MQRGENIELREKGVEIRQGMDRRASNEMGCSVKVIERFDSEGCVDAL